MDRCTKVTLMLIAAALWALVLEHAIGRVEAGSAPSPCNSATPRASAL